MRIFGSYVLLLLAPLLFATASVAQDLTGTWSLQASATLPVGEGTPGDDCFFEGSANVVQDGIDIGGTAQLELTDGVPGCPGTLMADITAFFIDEAAIGVSGDLSDPQFGLASFAGEFVDDGILEGGYSVQQGPFTGAGGSFLATRQNVVPAVAIPTLTPWMLSILALFLAVAAVAFLLRRGA